jgi:glycosyltransferase involved in cell wall biosynthesis
MFSLKESKLSLFFENGIPENFISDKRKSNNIKPIKLLFVGRLVPYKGADMLISALKKLDNKILNRVSLTIVGDGPEQQNLINQTAEFNLSDRISFAGWVEHSEILKFYKNSDIFCFPSIREFGGAVVLEAMACGLPCIVVNNGGIGEYVTADVGFKIEPLGYSHIIDELAKRIGDLVEDLALREKMSNLAIQRAQEFEWSRKARNVVSLYRDLIARY